MASIVAETCLQL